MLYNPCTHEWRQYDSVNCVHFTNKTWLWGQYGNRLGSPSYNVIWSEAKLKSIYHYILDWPVRKLHFLRKYFLFLILYQIYGFKNSYCLITSTNYSINQQMLIIKGLKSKPFKIYESKSCNICRTMYVVTIYLCKHSMNLYCINPK